MAHHGTHTADHHDDHGAPKGWRRWVYSTNHKDIGILYLFFACFAVFRRQLSVLQRGALGARHHHGVLPRYAGADRRLRQLFCAADDRRARHGVPAHEQH
jgi:hypothetical protein